VIDLKVIVVDGNNVAYCERDDQNRPQVQNLLTMHQTLQAYGWAKIIIFVTAKLKYYIDDRPALEQLICGQIVREAPAGSNDDTFIIQAAKAFDALIVSNDLFRDVPHVDPVWLHQRQLKFLIINGSVILEACEPTPSGLSASSPLSIDPAHWALMYALLDQAFRAANESGLLFTSLLRALKTAKKDGRLPLSNRLLEKVLRYLIAIGYLVVQADGTFRLLETLTRGLLEQVESFSQSSPPDPFTIHLQE
jgi:hypothetical protein